MNLPPHALAAHDQLQAWARERVGPWAQPNSNGPGRVGRTMTDTIRAVVLNPHVTTLTGKRPTPILHARRAIDQVAAREGRTVQPETMRLIKRTTAIDEPGLEALPPDTPVEVWQAECTPLADLDPA
ncbi:MAG: hypothetical protein M3N43_07835 [Actinomycetota bacterium]|nr:hypothetical protein [Actinomycetota bacterium]